MQDCIYTPGALYVARASTGTKRNAPLMEVKPRVKHRVRFYGISGSLCSREPSLFPVFVPLPSRPVPFVVDGRFFSSCSNDRTDCIAADECFLAHHREYLLVNPRKHSPARRKVAWLRGVWYKTIQISFVYQFFCLWHVLLILCSNIALLNVKWISSTKFWWIWFPNWYSLHRSIAFINSKIRFSLLCKNASPKI